MGCSCEKEKYPYKESVLIVGENQKVETKLLIWCYIHEAYHISTNPCIYLRWMADDDKRFHKH